MLTVSVSVVVGATRLTATSKDLTITGTNPTLAASKAKANAIGATKSRFRKQMRQESSLCQFTVAGWPKYSGDNVGGLGLCQFKGQDGDAAGMFVALTPNGTAVYRSDATYRFLPMDRPFGDAAVTRPMPGLAEPGLVFSAK